MFHKTSLCLLAVLTVAELSLQASLPTDKSYNAAVVEFAPSVLTESIKKMEVNMLNMLSVIESNVTDNLDIIVFPEWALSNFDYQTFVPDPKQRIAPCDIPDYDYYLVEISCAARSRNVYVVLNILEKEKCRTGKDFRCPSSGYNSFNTNVVFDRDGRVISRYRKTHLYGYEWYSTNVLEKPEAATFTTDFGVTFGHFICFDMLFYDPAIRLIRELNVTDIIYPTYWYSELPFLVATQLQEGWAYGNNVNLLAAGASHPSEKNTGSGIYAGTLGRLNVTINEEPVIKVLTAKVPKVEYRSEYVPPATYAPVTPVFELPRFTKLSLLRDNNVDLFSTTLLAADFTQVQNELLCHNDFCCNFTIDRVFLTQTSVHSAYRYRLAAYYGDQTTFQGKDPSAMAVCAVISCTSDELYSCGRIFPASVLVGNTHYFSKLEVSGSFPLAKRRVIMPSTVDGQMLPLTVDMYDMLEAQNGTSTKVTMNLKSPKANLLTFGIWGNYYTEKTTTHNLNDMEKLGDSGAINLSGCLYIICFMFLFKFFI